MRTARLRTSVKARSIRRSFSSPQSQEFGMYAGRAFAGIFGMGSVLELLGEGPQE